MRKKPARPKAVAYVLIPEGSEIGRPMYQMLASIVDEHHQEVRDTNARIVLAWRLGLKPDVDGRLVLGQCRKASDLDRELAPFDFIVLINRDFWQNSRVSGLQRRALLDHECCHMGIAYDENGEPKVDERGRTVFRIVKHSIEEFDGVVERYGCYKRDLEAFAQALTRAQQRTSGWVGYQRVQETLQAIGVDVALDTIRTWPEVQRREVLAWAQLRQEADVHQVSVVVSQTMPACLAAALGVTAAESTTH